MGFATHDILSFLISTLSTVSIRHTFRDKQYIPRSHISRRGTVWKLMDKPESREGERLSKYL
jgi:hypothetical protein